MEVEDEAEPAEEVAAEDDFLQKPMMQKVSLQTQRQLTLKLRMQRPLQA